MTRSYADVPGETTRSLDGVQFLVTQVQAVERHRSGLMVALLDRPIDNLPFAWSEARVLNRRSRARSCIWLVVRRASRVDIAITDDVLAVPLPADLRFGDLLAVPSRSVEALDAVRAALS